jgi:uncharacterized membrane protein YfbV (UPF0208 family)
MLCFYILPVKGLMCSLNKIWHPFHVSYLVWTKFATRGLPPLNVCNMNWQSFFYHQLNHLGYDWLAAKLWRTTVSLATFVI